MRRYVLISAFFIFGALVFHPTPARAGMHFCNKTNVTVNVAMATLDDEGLGDERAWGWWQIEPDGCKNPLYADLETDDSSRSYYYYAYDAAGDTWGGDIKFCVDTTSAFDFNDAQEIRCDTGAHRGFKWINIHGNTDWTVSLTS